MCSDESMSLCYTTIVSFLTIKWVKSLPVFSDLFGDPERLGFMSDGGSSDHVLKEKTD